MEGEAPKKKKEVPVRPRLIKRAAAHRGDSEWLTLFRMLDPDGDGRADKQTRYLLQYSCLPPPLFILLITAMQVTGYFIYACQEDKFEATGPVPFKSIFILNPHQRDSQFWRYITYIYSHLIGNVVMQLLIGVPLEMVHKFWRIGALYTAGVITGALLMSAADSGTYLGGASGGVYTLIAAHISNVSHTAHIGGFVAGLLLGIVLLRNLRLKRWEQIAWGVCLGLFFVFAAVLLGLVYYPLLFAPAPPAS
ncbi:Rhomboid domain-containing protein [Aphelenchoides fujianensis]|nr:Rhomboid domain-containing protein [Aphelenchoides fujianensis]